MKKILMGLTSVLALSLPVQSMATVYQVKALENSTSGGTGVSVAGLTTGNSFSVSVDPLDLWNSGVLPRWSNANGQIAPDLIATGAADTNGDNPGVPAGTVIGGDGFGTYNQGGLTAPFGALVGEWGNNTGNFFLIGTNFTGLALDSALKLYYFDSNFSDNTGSILANVTAVPEPETYGMMLVGLGMMGFMARRRKNT
jgi:hypothetical protein